MVAWLEKLSYYYNLHEKGDSYICSNFKFYYQQTKTPHNRMFRKTIQNIETTRTTTTQPSYPQADFPTGYNTQRYDRYLPLSEQPKPSQRKNISSGQFSQLKKVQANNRTSQLVIRECDPAELNHFKKPPMRLVEENVYPYAGSNSSSSKKQRPPLNPRQKPYDSNFTKQPLEEIHFSDRDNKSERYSTGIDPLFDLQQQFQGLKQYLLQTQSQQSTEMKKLKTHIDQVQVECMGDLQTLASQVTQQLTKNREDLVNINKRGVETQREVRHIRESLNAFAKDTQEKLQSLVLEMSSASTKKSKSHDEFGVSLKTSAQCLTGGVGTSMSVNFPTENVNMKLYNQTTAQLEMLKSQLQQCKEKIQLLEKDTKYLQLERKTSREEPKQTVKEKIDLKEVERMIVEKFSQERKKNSFGEKIQQLDMKTKDLYKVYQDMDSNIKGMNAEFTRVINGTVIKKEKMLESKLVAAEQKIIQISQKLTPQQLLDSLKPQLKSHLTSILEEKSPHIQVVKVRDPTSHEKSKLQSIKNAQFTYLMDEEGHLLDPSGNYIVETLENGSKQRVKVEKSVLYLLESQGVEIKNA